MEVAVSIPEFTDLDAIEKWIRERIQGRPSQLIAIDGANRTGKTCLAKEMAKRLSLSLVECDGFIVNGSRCYPEILDIGALEAALQSALSSGSVLVDSVLVQVVLDAVSLKPSATIYVRHSWPAGTYTHAALLDPQATEEELVAEIDQTCQLAGIPLHEPILERELVRYHKRTEPHKSADALFTTCFLPDVSGRADR